MFIKRMVLIKFKSHVFCPESYFKKFCNFWIFIIDQTAHLSRYSSTKIREIKKIYAHRD